MLFKLLKTLAPGGNCGGQRPSAGKRARLSVNCCRQSSEMIGDVFKFSIKN
jgi:hypothetical protein